MSQDSHQQPTTPPPDGDPQQTVSPDDASAKTAQPAPGGTYRIIRPRHSEVQSTPAADESPGHTYRIIRQKHAEHPDTSSRTPSPDQPPSERTVAPGQPPSRRGVSPDRPPSQRTIPAGGVPGRPAAPPAGGRTITPTSSPAPPASGSATPSISPTRQAPSPSQRPTLIDRGGATLPPTGGKNISQLPTQLDHGAETLPGQPMGSGKNVDLHARTAVETVGTLAEEQPKARQPINRNIQKVEHLVGKTCQGYRLERVLGAGGMGAVFLARQISLDRNVAIKVLPPEFSRNLEALSRFTREALSAAQLNHHNVVQVYDVGSENDLHFISMEYVKGESLGDMVRRDGRLRVDDAAGYVLQAARGLAYAHERGIIHRDIKPDNLMINEHGIVKIADMGLAKMRGVSETVAQNIGVGETMDPKMAALREGSRGDLTQASIGFGTPAYMSPEQARDAASVDARADQYSLGCTLYYLCAGKTPYSGTTAFELISKHLKEKFTPLETHVQNVPGAFQQILDRMLEKEPDKRYVDMHAVIDDIEHYLGVESEEGNYKPREQHLALLDRQSKAYYSTPMLKLRKLISAGFFSLVTAAFFLAIIMQSFWIAGGIAGLGALTPLCYFLINGALHRGFFFRRVRSVFFGMPLKSWLFFSGGVIIVLSALWIVGWFIPWLVFLVFAAALAAGYEFGVTQRLAQEREPALAATNQMLRELRVRGVGEEAIQEFICRFSGDHWEEFFENLFGYEDMLLNRGKSATQEKVRRRKRHAVWRDPIARWLDNLEEARKVAREKRALAKIEAKRLKAQGKSDKEAEKEAKQSAEKQLQEVKQASVAAEQKAQTKARAKAKAAKPEALPIAPLAKPRRRGIGLLGLVYQVPFSLARLALGLAIAGLFVLYVQPALANQYLPQFLTKWIQTYYAWGGGDQLTGGIAGALLILTALSRQFFFPLLQVLGTALLLAYIPLSNLTGVPSHYIGIIALALLAFSTLGVFSRRGSGRT